MASKQSLYQDVNINSTEIKARREWDKSYRRRQSLERIIVGLLPAGVVLMCIVFFLLSVPHTQRILEIITPGMAGFLSPLGFELGVIIFSALREAGWKSRLTLAILASILILSVFINVSGSIISVIEASGNQANMKALTIAGVVDQFGYLPLTYQVTLIVTVFVGALIPVIAKLAGESMIKLALGRIVLSRMNTDEVWAKEMSDVMYRALMKEAILKGANAALAASWASGVSEKMYGGQNRSETLDSPPTAPLPAIYSSDQPLSQPMPIQSIFAPRVKSQELAVWMNQNIDRITNLSNREVAKLYTKETFGSESDNAYKTVERIRKE